MNELPRRWLFLLLCGALTACATTAPPPAPGEAGCEALAEGASFEEACEEAGSLLALCDGNGCALYRCQEVAKHLIAGQVVRTRGWRLDLPHSQGSARRYWGSTEGAAKQAA